MMAYKEITLVPLSYGFLGEGTTTQTQVDRSRWMRVMPPHISCARARIGIHELSHQARSSAKPVRRAPS